MKCKAKFAHSGNCVEVLSAANLISHHLIVTNIDLVVWLGTMVIVWMWVMLACYSTMYIVWMWVMLACYSTMYIVWMCSMLACYSTMCIVWVWVMLACYSTMYIFWMWVNIDLPRNNAHSKSMKDIAHMYNLTFASNHTRANFEFTYENVGAGHCSSVDHFVVPNRLYDCIDTVECRIIDLTHLFIRLWNWCLKLILKS